MFKRRGFNNSITEESNGYSGCIWMFWKDSNIKINCISQSRQFIHVTLHIDNQIHWFLTIAYGCPNSYIRQTLWLGLIKFQPINDTPWLVTGDFNAFISS